MKKIIIEAGCHRTTDTDRLLSLYSDAVYYGFEPTIHLYEQALKKYKNKTNVYFLPFALSDSNGFANFKIYKHLDYQPSSLYDLVYDHGEIIPGLNEKVEVEDNYNVPTITLKTFLNNFIKEDYVIEYLWIDAEGSDLKILKGLEENIYKVKKGQIEVATDKQCNRVEGNNLDMAIKFMKSKNFLYKIEKNDLHNYQCNVLFYNYKGQTL